MTVAAKNWGEYILQITVSSGRDMYTFVSYYCTFERFVEQVPNVIEFSLFSVVNVLQLNESCFEAIEDVYRNENRVVEE